MKKTLLTIAFLLTSMWAFNQDFTSLADIAFNNAEDYRTKEALVKECASFILSQPYKSEEQNKLYGIQFILRWMEGTPDYMFSLGQDYSDLCKNDLELSTTYLAALALAAVDPAVVDKSSDNLSKQAKEFFLDYCARPENKVKTNRSIKKALEEKSGQIGSPEP
ncbi:MAG: hypothetical protein R2751_02825 [Bacteroidales bacterium]